MINNAFWLGLPETLAKIDAAYERADGRLMLFSGFKYFKILKKIEIKFLFRSSILDI
jgi:hypothetical protein